MTKLSLMVLRWPYPGVVVFYLEWMRILSPNETFVVLILCILLPAFVYWEPA